MKQPSVLIVDDEPDILTMIRTALEMEGFETALAGDGETALERARERPPDVILLDIMMPMLDGWAVIETLAEQRRRPALVVISAKARARDLARAFRMGADAYVTKPFDFDALTATIREVLARPEKDRARHRQELLERLQQRAAEA